MHRLLVVLRGPVDAATVREECRVAQLAVAGPHKMAVCHVLASGQDSIADALRAQRQVTALLRHVLGTAAAERVPVFVASERDGQRVEDCGREWGATVVHG